MAIRDPNGDGAKLSIAAAHIIENLLQERKALLQELEREQPETTESPASKPATPRVPFGGASPDYLET